MVYKFGEHDKNKDETVEVHSKVIPDERKTRRVYVKITPPDQAKAISEARDKKRRRDRASERAAAKTEGKAEVASAMLANGFSVNKIAELTGLSQKKIESLQKQKPEIKTDATGRISWLHRMLSRFRRKGG